MFKLMHKKLNKKGFTLAELLVVVAIVAILVAIAVPIFIDSMTEAQIRTNEANIRSTKAAAVSYVLAHWNDEVQDMSGTKYKDGADGASKGGNGWYAYGDVDKAGNLRNVTVKVNPSGSSGTVIATDEGILAAGTTVTPGSTHATSVNQTGNISPAYRTLVYIEDTEIKEPA